MHSKNQTTKEFKAKFNELKGKPPSENGYKLPFNVIE